MSEERRRQVLRLKINGDGVTASLVDERGVAVADGDLRPDSGVEYVITAGTTGQPVECPLTFVGTVV